MSKLSDYLKKNFVFILCTIFVYFLFLHITSLAPYAGDDWVYAINGTGNSFSDALTYYYSWSGRLFCEFLTYVLTSNKLLWNYFNAIQFAAIYMCLYALINPKKNSNLIAILIVVLMLTVKDMVRMQTYTWAAGGAAYTTPLLLMLIYLLLIKLSIIKEGIISSISSIILVFVSFIISISMTNLAVTLILFNVFALIYAKYRNKNTIVYAISLVVSVLGFIITMLSPGNALRMAQDHATWNEMNIFMKMAGNFKDFIKYSYFENRILILVLSIVLMYVIIKDYQRYKNKYAKYLLLIITLTDVLILMNIVIKRLDNSLLNSIFSLESGLGLAIASFVFILFTFTTYYVFYLLYNDEKILGPIVMLTMAGIANGAMLASPIFSARNSLYFIYFVIVVIGMLVSEVNINKYIGIFLIIILSLITYKKYEQLNYKYTLVNAIQKDRLEKIEYYRQNPDDLEIYLPRMPDYGIHSADIEPEDETHQFFFKKYYNLNLDAKIYMYWSELSNK